MNIRHILTILLCGAATLGGAAREAADIFAEAPQEIFPLLEPSVRLDMVDYYRSNLATPSANTLDGRSVITEMTPSSLTVKLTESSACQIALLPAGSDTIVALVSTVAAPALDSTVSFYDTSWKPFRSKPFEAPGWKQWAVTPADARELPTLVPFMLASARIDPETYTLTLTPTLDRFIDEDTYAGISPLLRPSLTYRWTGKRYTPAK